MRSLSLANSLLPLFKTAWFFALAAAALSAFDRGKRESISWFREPRRVSPTPCALSVS